MPKYTIVNGELMHYGVKGMKWGVRKKRDAPPSDAKSRMRAAKKDYNKAYSNAYDRAIAAWSPVKKHRQANNERWADVAKKRAAYDDAKKEYKAEKRSKTNSAIKEYRSKFDAAERASNLADKKWNEVSEQYRALGKNRIARMFASTKSEAWKKYSKSWDEWEKLDSIADQKWNETKQAYRDTGSNFVSRVLNQIEYDRSRKRKG